MGPDAAGQWVSRWRSAQWEATADAWVRDRLAERGRSISANPVTYRARFWSVVRCYPSDAGLIWFKENNPGHRFEAALVRELARLAPDHIAAPLAVDRDRGWLLTDDRGNTLSHSDVANQSIRRVIVRELARLQCALIGRLRPDDHPGMALVEPWAAGDWIRAVVRRWRALPPKHPLHLDRKKLERAESAAEVLDERTALLSDSVALDVEVNDVYPANIAMHTSSQPVMPRFFDFGNTLWAHPFVSVHGFIDAVENWGGTPISATDRDCLYEDYLSVWLDHVSADLEVLQADLAITAALVDVHRLAAWVDLLSHADEIEMRARANLPLQSLEAVCAVSGGGVRDSWLGRPKRRQRHDPQARPGG